MPALEMPLFGTGTHVFSVSVQYAPAAGEVWGYTTNTRLNSVLLQYSVPLTHGAKTRLRFAPELVPFATLLERSPSQTNPSAPVRSYAMGARPAALEVEFLRGRRVEPFLGTHGGFLYYNRRVLVPAAASHFMLTVDFGGGVRLFTSPQNAFHVSYSYQHQSNANISVRNPGTDNHVISLGFSHFSRR